MASSSLGIVNPKKRREIDGVGGSSMVDLKATLFKAEEDAKRAKTTGIAAPKSRLVVKAPTLHNKGVDERNRRDLEEEQRRQNSGGCLSNKMQQYEAMSMVGYRDHKESFLVDFEQKRWDQERKQGGGAGNDSLAQGIGGAAGVVTVQGDTDRPEAIVRRHQGDGVGAGQVLLALGDQMRTERERGEELKAQRLAAAKRRMLKKKRPVANSDTPLALED